MNQYQRRKLAGDCGSCGQHLPRDADTVLCLICIAKNRSWKAQHPERIKAHRVTYEMNRKLRGGRA